MHKTSTILVLVVMIALASLRLHADLLVLNTISETISRYNIENRQIDNRFATTGMYPNKMATCQKFIYVTNSGDNNVQVIDVKTGETEKLIHMEEFSNPYDIIIHGSYLYVTGMLTNKVYRIDVDRLEVIDEVKVGLAPQGLLALGNNLYVANSGVSYPNYSDGELSVIDLDSFTLIDSLKVPTNAQRMAVCDLNKIHLVCTGDYDEISGEVVVINPESLEIEGSVKFNNYPMNILIPANNNAYVGDAFNLGVFTYDSQSLEIMHRPGNEFASGGGSFLELNEFIVIADAKDFTSNSTISFYSLREELLFSFDAAIGAIDLASAAKQTNIEDRFLKPQISVYPNPSRDSFRINIIQPQSVQAANHDVNSQSSIKIHNIRGQLIESIDTTTRETVWDGTCSNNIPVASGIYFINITESGNTGRKRVTLIR